MIPLSIDQARERYGVAIDAGSLTVDAEETAGCAFCPGQRRSSTVVKRKERRRPGRFVR